MREKNKNNKLNDEYFKDNKSNTDGANKKFISAVDVVASIEMFEEYAYSKHNLKMLEGCTIENELSDKFLYIDDIIKNYEHILNMEGALKSKKIIELFQIKKLLLNYYEEYRFLSLYSHHMFRLYSYWRSKNDRYHRKYDLEGFYNNLYNSLKVKKSQTLKIMQREILMAVPIRMTKNSFLEYMQTSLTGMIEEDFDYALDGINGIYGMVNEDLYPREDLTDNLYYTCLKEYNDANFREMSGRKLLGYCGGLKRYTADLNRVYETIWSYIMSLNRIMIVLLDFDMDYATLVKEEPLVYYTDRYVTIPDERQDKRLGKSIFHEIRSAVRKWYDVLKKYSVKIENINGAAFDKGNMPEQDLVDLINYFYYLNTIVQDGEGLTLSDFYDIPSEDLYEVVDNIIHDIDIKLNKLKPDEKRVFMSDMISSVDPVFKDLDEFLGFVKKSMEFDTTDAEKSFAINDINDILKYYKYHD